MSHAAAAESIRRDHAGSMGWLSPLESRTGACCAGPSSHRENCRQSSRSIFHFLFNVSIVAASFDSRTCRDIIQHIEGTDTDKERRAAQREIGRKGQEQEQK